MKPYIQTSRQSILVMLALALLVVAGCGDAGNDFVVTSNAAGTTEPNPDPLPVGEAILTLESTLELSKSISTSVTSLKFTTFDSKGTQLFVSEPIPKSPQIKVSIPLGSSDVKIDYLDPTGEVKEIWGSPIPPLELNEEFVVRDPNPDSTLNVTRLEIEGPLTLPTGIPTQYRARAFYLGGQSRLVTNSARWSSTGGVDVSASGSATSQSRTGSGTVSASFGGRAASLTVQPRPIEAIGAPFFADESGGFVVNTLTLDGFGAQAQLRLFSDFADGVRREVTTLSTFSAVPANVVTINGLAKITAVNSGQTTVTGLFRSRQGALSVTVGKDFFTTVFENFRSLSPSLGGFSPAFKLADLNLDGRLDVVGLPSSGAGVDYTRLAVHFGNGDGTFKSPEFVSLPFSANPSAAPVIFVGSFKNRRDSVFIGNSAQSRAAVVTQSGSSLRQLSYSLPAAPKEFFQSRFRSPGTVDLLTRTVDDRLVMLNSTSLSLSTPFQGNFEQTPVSLNFQELDADELVSTAVINNQGRLVHFARPRTSSDPAPAVRLLELNRVDNTFIVRRTISSAPLLFALPRPEIGQLDLLELSNGATQPDVLTIKSNGTSGNEIRTERSRSVGSGNNRLTAFEFGTSTRFRDTIVTGGAQPIALNSLRVISELPIATFANFDTGDVNGDGIDDIASWQDGSITLTAMGVQ